MMTRWDASPFDQICIWAGGFFLTFGVLGWFVCVLLNGVA